MEIRRRTLQNEPGEALLIARSALDTATRFSDWLDLSGLPAERVLADPLISVPVPLASARDGDARRWPAAVNPEIMWHPLMWLPERLARRYRVEAEDGSTRVESDAEWVVRLALELSMSSLYDLDSGTWLDVLSTVDLDIDDPAVQERVSTWLHGGADDILDNIDLSPLVDVEAGPDWALESAEEILPTLQPASWALLSDDLTKLVLEVVEGAATLEEARHQTDMIASLAISALASVPAAGDEEAPAALWRRVIAELPHFDGSLDDLLAGPLDQLSESFYAIRDDYWPFLELLAEATTDSAGA